MLRNLSEMKGYAIHAADGMIGHVTDCYFDDESWVVRYLVVETGSWLMNRKVLISPIAINQREWNKDEIPVSITKEQVKNSPDIDTDKPVSRQHEGVFLGYYGYPNYWGGAGLWGAGMYPGMMLSGASYGGADTRYHQLQLQQAHAARAERTERQSRSDDIHLRSGKEIVGYHLHVTDGDIGHVQDVIIEEQTWAIRYLVVNTSNWWIGHQVLIAPQWIDDVTWTDNSVSSGLSRKAVQDAPPYTSTEQLSRQLETSTYQHYGRSGYWINEPQSKATEPA